MASSSHPASKRRRSWDDIRASVVGSDAVRNGRVRGSDSVSIAHDATLPMDIPVWRFSHPPVLRRQCEKRPGRYQIAAVHASAPIGVLRWSRAPGYILVVSGCPYSMYAHRSELVSQWATNPRVRCRGHGRMRAMIGSAAMNSLHSQTYRPGGSSASRCVPKRLTLPDRSRHGGLLPS